MPVCIAFHKPCCLPLCGARWVLTDSAERFYPPGPTQLSMIIKVFSRMTEAFPLSDFNATPLALRRRARKAAFCPWGESTPFKQQQKSTTCFTKRQMFQCRSPSTYIISLHGTQTTGMIAKVKPLPNAVCGGKSGALDLRVAAAALLFYQLIESFTFFSPILVGKKNSTCERY